MQNAPMSTMDNWMRLALGSCPIDKAANERKSSNGTGESFSGTVEPKTLAFMVFSFFFFLYEIGESIESDMVVLSL